LPTGLHILLALISFSFFKYCIALKYLKIYWTDFHNLFTKWKVFVWVSSIRISFSDSSSDITRATNFGQDWRNNLHSTRWHAETDSNIAIPCVELQYFCYISCKFDHDPSSNPRDYEGSNCNIWDETAKVGISHRISQHVLDRSSPDFQRWYTYVWGILNWHNVWGSLMDDAMVTCDAAIDRIYGIGVNLMNCLNQNRSATFHSIKISLITDRLLLHNRSSQQGASVI